MLNLQPYLKFNPDFLVKIDLTEFGIPNSDFYIYLDYKHPPQFAGNKLRKLYGSIDYCLRNNINNIITVGGNFSNYLYACAFIPESTGINITAIIKGHEPKDYGFMLELLKEKNIEIHFCHKDQVEHLKNELLNSNSYSIFIPEGGKNEFSHLGFEPLICDHFNSFDKICVGVGTSATYQAIDRYKDPQTHLLGYAAHPDSSLEGNLVFDYTFGGFAKMNPVLLNFVEEFYKINHIILDPIYTSKMIFGIIEDYKKGIHLPSNKILAIHTGGIDGWKGMKMKPDFH